MKELRQLPKHQRQKLWLKYLTIVFGSVGAFVLISSVTLLAFFVPTYTTPGGTFNQVNNITGTTGGTGGFDFRNLLPIAQDQTPVITTFVIYGIDNDDDDIGGADVIMVGSFNRLTGNIEIMNIPRDTFVTERPNTQAVLNEIGAPWPVIRRITDLFRVANFRGEGPRVVNVYLEEWLGINIHYYVVVDLVAFRLIVDMVGPIEMYIPRRMDYNNGAGFIINVDAGWQQLDGRRAEMVVRYRRYADGDISRIGVQQEFLQLMFHHMMQLDVLLNVGNLIEFVNIFMDHVETNVTPATILAYSPHIGGVEGLSLVTMPGNSAARRDFGHFHNQSIVLPFEHEITTIVNRIFHGIILDDFVEEPTITAENH